MKHGSPIADGVVSQYDFFLGDFRPSAKTGVLSPDPDEQTKLFATCDSSWKARAARHSLIAVL
jgi:hypothetical protein